MIAIFPPHLISGSLDALESAPLQERETRDGGGEAETGGGLFVWMTKKCYACACVQLCVNFLAHMVVQIKSPFLESEFGCSTLERGNRF